MKISDVRLVSATAADRGRGLIGYASCVLDNSLRIDGLTIRRTLDGRLAVSFPSKRDCQGREHFLLRPLSDDARREIQSQIFEQLGFLREASTP